MRLDYTFDSSAPLDEQQNPSRVASLHIGADGELEATQLGKLQDRLYKGPDGLGTVSSLLDAMSCLHEAIRDYPRWIWCLRMDALNRRILIVAQGFGPKTDLKRRFYEASAVATETNGRNQMLGSIHRSMMHALGDQCVACGGTGDSKGGTPPWCEVCQGRGMLFEGKPI